MSSAALTCLYVGSAEQPTTLDHGDCEARLVPPRFVTGIARFVALGLACAVLLAAAVLLSQARRDGAPLAEATAGALVALDTAQANLATCVIDADQAAFYLIQAINYIHFSVEGCKVMVDLDNRTSCAEKVTTVIASFGWLGSYAAATINSCGSEVNVAAACGAAMSAFVACLGELSFVASAVVGSCDLFTPLEDLPLRDPADPTKHLDQLSAMQKMQLIKAEQPVEQGENPLRGWSVSQCIVDLNLGVTYVGRVGIQTYFLATECTESGVNFNRKKCAVDLFNVISSIAWAAQFLANAAIDCPEIGASGAACAGVVSDFVATVAALGPIVNGISDDCQHHIAGHGVGEDHFE